MIVSRLPVGQWVVRDTHYDIVAGPFATNGQAWKALDRLEGAPVNRSQATSEWSWNKRVHGE